MIFVMMSHCVLSDLFSDLYLLIDLWILGMITVKTKMLHLNLWIFRFLQVKQVMNKYKYYQKDLH